MGTWDKVKVFFGFSEENEQRLQEASTNDALSLSHSSSIGGVKAPALTTSVGSGAFPSSVIQVEAPRIYEDSLHIAARLREGTPVIVNLKLLDSDTGKRLIDFVCGTTYAINGHMMKVGENIFLFTSENIQIANESAQGIEEIGDGGNGASSTTEPFFNQKLPINRNTAL